MRKSKPGIPRLGEYMKAIRTAHGFSQVKVADGMGIRAEKYHAFEESRQLPDGDEMRRFRHVIKPTPMEWKELVEIYLTLGKAEEELNQDKALILQLVRAAEPSAPGGGFARLIGAAISLEQAWNLLTLNPHLDPDTWKLGHLLPDIRDSINKKGYIDLAHTLNLVMWAVGFFRNKAHENLAFVFMRSINQWLKTGIDDLNPDPSHIMEKLFMLERITTDQIMSKEKIHEFTQSFTTYSNIKDAVARMQECADVCTRELNDEISATELFYSAPIQTIKDTDCVSIMFCRYNGDHEIGKAGWLYRVEWAVTAKALLTIGEFRRRMLVVTTTN